MVEKFVLALFVDDKEKRSCSFTRLDIKQILEGLLYAKTKDYYRERKKRYDEIYKKISEVRR